MKKINLKQIIVLFILTNLMVFSLTPAMASAASIFDQIFRGAAQTTNAAYGSDTGKKATVTTFLGSLIFVLNRTLEFLGVVFFAVVVYAGFLWFNARGKAEEVERAKRILTDAVIALIIILFARLLTEFVLTNVGKIIS